MEGLRNEALTYTKSALEAVKGKMSSRELMFLCEKHYRIICENAGIMPSENIILNFYYDIKAMKAEARAGAVATAEPVKVEVKVKPETTAEPKARRGRPRKQKKLTEKEELQKKLKELDMGFKLPGIDKLKAEIKEKIEAQEKAEAEAKAKRGRPRKQPVTVEADLNNIEAQAEAEAKNIVPEVNIEPKAEETLPICIEDQEEENWDEFIFMEQQAIADLAWENASPENKISLVPKPREQGGPESDLVA
jgi:hypothetical protein